MTVRPIRYRNVAMIVNRRARPGRAIPAVILLPSSPAMANSLKKAAGRLASGRAGEKKSTETGDSTSVTKLKGKATARKAKRKVRSLG